MGNSAVRIIQTPTAPEYDLRDLRFDLTRKTGVLIRQSKKGADVDSRESRLRQESLVPVAISLRGDTDGSNIILYDEGSGVSGTKGYDERPQLSRLYLDIANGVIGSIVVARVDRLFRDKHFLNVGMFTEIAERQHVALIVPGRAVYDFTNTRDLQTFQREMQEAYNYIATQVAYMQDTRMQKIRRGRYGGGNLPAPYAIDRSVDKDQQMPVVYRPWLPIAIDLFERFRDYDFVLARIARYIEAQPYIFPYPSAEDHQRYMFKTLMRTVPGGYTFSSGASIRGYFSNLVLGGYAKIGKDSEGNTLFLENAFEPAVPMDLLGASYAAITGHHPDGSPFERKTYTVRSHSGKSGMESLAVLHGLLDSDDGMVFYHGGGKNSRPFYGCNKDMLDKDGWSLKGKPGIMQAKRVWSVPCEDLDHIVITRLCELARFDGDMAERIEAFWERRRSDELSEEHLLNTQIEKAAAQIRRLDKLLTDPAFPLSADAERRYLEMLRDAEVDRDRLLKKQVAQERQRNPAEVIANFYQVLAHLPTEYKRLAPEGQKRMVRQVIQDIRLNMLSPHLFILRIHWQVGIAMCPDVALVWRGKGARIGYDWAPEEEAIIKSLYPGHPQIDIMRALPRRAWQSIREHASALGLRREIDAGTVNSYYATICYADLEAVDHMANDSQQQERWHHVVDELARRTVRGGLSVCWWQSLDAVSYAGTTGAEDSGEVVPFNVSLRHGAHR